MVLCGLLSFGDVSSPWSWRIAFDGFQYCDGSMILYGLVAPLPHLELWQRNQLDSYDEINSPSLK